MASIDERVVAMAFENSVFESRVSTTITTLGKLDSAIKNMGNTSGFDQIEKSANKVTLQGPITALDKLKARLSRSSDGAESLGDIDKAGNKVTLEGPTNAVDKLQSKMGQLSAGTTFTDIEKASSRVSLEGLTHALDTVTAKFSVLEGAAAVALGNISSQAIMKGANFAKGFGIGPIIDGLHEYQTNLQSIQTIQANTDRPLTEINRSLQQLNDYSDKTIYNFSQMARNIGTFTAAGVDLKTSVSSIKGIANLAALSGSSAQQAATAMYQLSQAIASGKVGLQDWNSVVNAGMGGKKLQNALAQTAVAMGDIGASSVKLEGPLKKLTINGKSFRESIMAGTGDKPWLTSEVLVNTLATLDGRFSKAALSAELTKDGLKKYTAAQVEASIADSRAALEKKNGVKYTDEQFKALTKLSDSAFKSATEVKTLGQVFDVAKETIGSGWAASFQNIFGTLTEAKTTFTELSGSINGFINRTSLARNELLAGWKAMGGRTAAIQGIKNVFNVLGDVFGKVGKAFREIFPRTTSKELFNLTERFLVFTAHLNNSPAIIDDIARTFKGFFAILHIGWTIVKDITGVIFDLLGIVGKGSGGFLNFTGNIADFIVSIDEAISKGGALNGFFEGLTAVLSVPVEILSTLASLLGGLFGESSSSDAEKFAGSMDTVRSAVSPMGEILDRLGDAWSKFLDIFDRIKTAVSPALTEIAEQFSNFATLIKEAIENADWDGVFLALQTTFIGGIFLTIKKAIGGGISDIGGGVLGNVNNILKTFTGNLEAMQTKLHAEALLAIAGAVVVLAAGIFILSTIDGDKLAKAMTATAVGMAQLVGALKILSAGVGKAGIALLPVMAAGLIGVAVASLILAGAVKIFSTMDWEELAKGLAGLGGALVAVGLGVKLIGPGILPAAVAMIPLAIGLNILAVAVKQFSSIKWGDLIKGLVGVGGSLAVIGVAMGLMPPTLLITSAGVVVLAAGLVLLSAAVATFGSMSLGTMAKGILGIAAAIIAIDIAMAGMPLTIGVQAAGLVVLGIALTALAGAVAIFGSMSVAKLAKGIIAMGASLVVLAIGLDAMIGTLPGAVALLGAAAAFAILGPTLAFMGNLKWATIGKGLAAMAATLAVLAVVGALAAGPLILLGAALATLGLGMIGIATSVYILAKAFQLLGDTGTKGVTTLLVALTAFIAILPTIVINFVKGLVEIIKGIADIAPQVTVALGKILGTMIQFVVDQAPKLAVAIKALITLFVTVINDNAVPIINAGINLIKNLLNAMANNIGPIVATGAKIIVRFLEALTSKLPQVVAAGAKTIVKFLEGITKQMPKIFTAAGKMIIKFLEGITGQIPKVIPKAAKLVTTFLGEIASQASNMIKAGTRVIVKVITGIGNAIPDVLKAGARVVRKFLNGMAELLPDLVDAGFKAVIKFLHGVAKAIRDNDDEMIDAGFDIADAIVDGMVKGLNELAHRVWEAADHLALGIPGRVKKILDILSPSKVMWTLGKYTALGLAYGIRAHAAAPVQSVTEITNGMIAELNKIKGGKAPSELTKAIGKSISDGFAKGLTGSESDINAAFSDLRSNLNDQIKETRAQVKADKEALEAELSKKQKDQDPQAINELRAAIALNTADLAKMTNTRRFLNQGLKEERGQLLALSSSYKKISDRLEKAKEALKAIVAERDQAAAGFQDKYSVTPTISADTSLVDYNKQLADRIAAVQKYHATLQALRAAGLDDTTYRQLLDQGTEGQKFADQLLAAGKPAIDQIGVMDKDLQSAAKTLGDAAAENLYAAGIRAAEGLVNGLKSEKKTLRKLMEDLADAMVRALKKKLRIKSPSQVFAEMGEFVNKGLAKGLEDTTAAEEAAARLGANLTSALSGAIEGSINVDPVISPVLDLSQVEKKATELAGMLPEPTLTASTSVDQAGRISSQIDAAKSAADAAAASQAATNPSVSFEQNNYSPDPLSNIEIYRQTRNQLSQIKDALGVPK